MSIASNEIRWLSKKAATGLLGLGARRFDALVVQGLIGVLQLPDCPPRYSAVDVAKLVEQYSRPARAENLQAAS